ncbi:MAG: hypothetical protein ABEJ74_04835 [Haloferacaceae archaeon]
MSDEMPETSGYGRTVIAINAVIAVVVSYLLVWWASGFAVATESLFRIQPTVQGGGVGTEWVLGNTAPLFDALIAITHAADFLLGLFILLMVFVHWGAFRRLASQMRQPGEEMATDGGEQR